MTGGDGGEPEQPEKGVKESKPGRLRALLADVQPLEVRLDVTVLWIHVLGRGLVTEILTRPLKAVPSIQPEDLAILLKIVSSGSSLTVWWFLVGAFVTRQFSWEAGRQEAAGSALAPLWTTVRTCLLAGPLWIATEEALRIENLLRIWSPLASEEEITAAMLSATSVSSSSLDAVFLRDASSLLYLMMTMISARIVSLWIP